jgi:hypothetical protein
MINLFKRNKKSPDVLDYPIVQIGAKNIAGNTWTEDSVKGLLELYHGMKSNLYGEFFGSVNSQGNIVNPSNITHIVEDLYIDDGFVLARIKFTKDKNSEEAQSGLLQGLGFLSLRVTGEIDRQKNNEIVVSDLIAVDIIFDNVLFSKREIHWISI